MAAMRAFLGFVMRSLCRDDHHFFQRDDGLVIVDVLADLRANDNKIINKFSDVRLRTVLVVARALDDRHVVLVAQVGELVQKVLNALDINSHKLSSKEKLREFDEQEPPTKYGCIETGHVDDVHHDLVSTSWSSIILAH